MPFLPVDPGVAVFLQESTNPLPDDDLDTGDPRHMTILPKDPEPLVYLGREPTMNDAEAYAKWRNGQMPGHWAVISRTERMLVWAEREAFLDPFNGIEGQFPALRKAIRDHAAAGGWAFVERIVRDCWVYGERYKAWTARLQEANGLKQPTPAETETTKECGSQEQLDRESGKTPLPAFRLKGADPIRLGDMVFRGGVLCRIERFIPVPAGTCEIAGAGTYEVVALDRTFRHDTVVYVSERRWGFRSERLNRECPVTAQPNFVFSGLYENETRYSDGSSTVQKIAVGWLVGSAFGKRRFKSENLHGPGGALIQKTPWKEVTGGRRALFPLDHTHRVWPLYGGSAPVPYCFKQAKHHVPKLRPAILVDGKELSVDELWSPTVKAASQGVIGQYANVGGLSYWRECESKPWELLAGVARDWGTGLHEKSWPPRGAIFAKVWPPQDDHG